MPTSGNWNINHHPQIVAEIPCPFNVAVNIPTKEATITNQNPNGIRLKASIRKGISNIIIAMAA
jgi:hypothetical protein